MDDAPLSEFVCGSTRSRPHPDPGGRVREENVTSGHEESEVIDGQGVKIVSLGFRATFVPGETSR